MGQELGSWLGVDSMLHPLLQGSWLGVDIKLLPLWRDSWLGVGSAVHPLGQDSWLGVGSASHHSWQHDILLHVLSQGSWLGVDSAFRWQQNALLQQVLWHDGWLAAGNMLHPWGQQDVGLLLVLCHDNWLLLHILTGHPLILHDTSMQLFLHGRLLGDSWILACSSYLLLSALLEFQCLAQPILPFLLIFGSSCL